MIESPNLRWGERWTVRNGSMNNSLASVVIYQPLALHLFISSSRSCFLLPFFALSRVSSSSHKLFKPIYPPIDLHFWYVRKPKRWNNVGFRLTVDAVRIASVTATMRAATFLVALSAFASAASAAALDKRQGPAW